jgi:hypothetical protein
MGGVDTGDKSKRKCGKVVKDKKKNSRLAVLILFYYTGKHPAEPKTLS